MSELKNTARAELFLRCACGEPEWNDTGQCERCQDRSERFEDDALSYDVSEEVYYNICDR